MAADSVAAALVVLLAAFAGCGALASWLAWTRQAWDEMYRESGIPATGRTVAFTRAGTTVGALALSAAAVAGLLSHWSFLRASAGLPRTPVDAVAAVLAGTALVAPLAVLGAAMVVAPFALALWDWVAAASGRA